MTDMRPPSYSATDGGVVADVYNPIELGQSIGAIFLGVLALILLFALLRAQKRNRQLLEKLSANA